MTSTLYVDNLIEKTSGNGVHIPGHVLQCVSSDDAKGWTSSSSTSLVASGISLSITPKFANSIILVDFHFPMTHVPTTGSSLVAAIYRNGTNLGLSGYPQGFIHNSNGAPQYPSVKLECRDISHGSTSALTYEVYFRSTSGDTVHLTHNGSDTHVKLWEIAQ
jgi:hypothetical protein